MLKRQPKESPLSGNKEKKQFIGEQLLSAGLITQKQLDEALAIQQESGGKMIEILMREGYINAQTFVQFLSKHQGIAGIDLLNYMIPKEVIQLIPEDLAREHELIPIDRMGKYLTIAMACPMDTKTLRDMEERTGLRIKPLLVSMNDLHAALNRYYGSNRQQAIQDFNTMPYASNPSGGLDQRTRKLREEAVAELSAENSPSTVSDMPRAAQPLTANTPDNEAASRIAVSTATPDNASAQRPIDIQPLVEQIINLESLPIRVETKTALERLLCAADATSGDVAACVQQDPGMAAMVLKAANTSENSFSHTIGNIELAIALLGNQEVLGIVQEARTVSTPHAGAGFDRELFWRRAIFCAEVARRLALENELKDIGTAYAAGLLHDIGKLVLADIEATGYQAIPNNASETAILKDEMAHFGISHPEVGLILADAWGMPNTLTGPIRFHNTPDEAHESKRIVNVVALAARLTDLYTQILDPDTQGLLEALKIPETRLWALFSEAIQENSQDATP